MAKPTRSGQSIRTRTLNRGAVFSTGMLFCLCLGFLDLLRNLVFAPHGLSSFPLVLELLAAGILTFLFLYLITWLLIGSSLELLLRLDPLPRAVAVGVFLSAATAVVSLPGIDFSQWSASVFVVAVFLGFCLVASGGAYYLTQAAETKPHSRGVAAVIALAGPIVLAETLLFVWFEVFEIFGSASYAVIFCRLGYLAAVAGTLWVVVRFRQRVSAVKVPPYAVLVFLLIPIGIRIFSGLGGFAGVHVAPQERTSERKRVFLITIDTLRADALSCYNRRTASTPHIDRLAADGIVFENAVSPASWTLPAMASLMTGLPPSVHRTVGRTARLPGKLMTLAEVMRDAGYRTTGVGLSTYLGRPFNILQGFDEYAVFPRSVGNSLGASVLKSLAAERFARLISTSELTDVACRRVAAHREEDLFFWVHYFDPHDPYTPPADYLPRKNPPRSIGNEFSKIEEIRSGHFVPNRQERSWIGELYKAEVRYMDESVGRFLDTLRRLDLYDESLIIFTSDHGEEFWDHGGQGHGHTLYNEVLRVPLIIKLPLSAERPGGGQHVSSWVSTMRIMPTILDLCRIERDPADLPAASLRPLWAEGDSPPQEEPIVSSGMFFYEDRESVIFDGYKYIRSLVSGREELYDLRQDPEERVSLPAAAQDPPAVPDRVAQARDLLREHHRQAATLRTRLGITDGEQAQLDPDTIRSLKSLGYLP